MGKRVVIALGGNALGNNLPEQMIAVKQTARAIVDLIEEGHEVIIAHGNGPQVGMIQKAMAELTRSEPEKYIPCPLSVCVAMSQGYIGYDLQNALREELLDRGISKGVATVLTQVEVNRDDPAFQNPTKPVGPVYSKEEAEKLAAEKGWTIAQDNDKFRRVVASPQPKRIWGLKPLKTLVEAGYITICCGGGGIPTYFKDGQLVGAEAVIDKDLASSVLAASIEADLFMIATDVNGAYVGWGTPDKKRIAQADPASLREFGFAKGSMGPKIEAACRFVEATGRVAVIGALDEIDAILAGKAGTRVVPEKGVIYE